MGGLLLVNRHMILLPINVTRANVNHLLHLSLTSRHQEVQGSQRVDSKSVEHLRPRFWNDSCCCKMKSNIHPFQRLEQTLVILYVPDHCLRLGTQVKGHTMGRTDKASHFCSKTIQQLRQMAASKTSSTSD